MIDLFKLAARARWAAPLAKVAIVVGGLLPLARAGAQSPAATTPLVFDGVTVIDVQQGHRLAAQRVVIVGNRIRTMGGMRAVPVPAGAHVVDARGKYLIPGLWDMHTHAVRATDVFYPLFLANGVTGIRDAASPVPLDTLRLWRQEILAGTRVGPPRQLLSGPAIDEKKGCKRGRVHSNGIQEAAHTCVADSADARHLVDSLKAAGADLIKTYALGRALYFVIAAEARRVDIPFGGHLVPGVATAIEASDSGAWILDHVNDAGDLDGRCWATDRIKRDRVSVARCQPVVDRFRRQNTWWVPTLITTMMLGMSPHPPEPICARFVNFSNTFWTGAPFRRDWLRDTVSPSQAPQAVQTCPSADSEGFLQIVHRVGLPILAGTDVNAVQFLGFNMMSHHVPGFGLHAELALYVAEGLTPLEALRTATLNPATALHATDSLGTVAPGKLADLVLLDADPLADIRNTTMIQAVVANGRYFDRPALDQLLATAQAKYTRVIPPH